MKSQRTIIGQPVVRLGKLSTLIIAIALFSVATFTARASDPVGVYGFVDRVVMEPNDTAPERIQVWGAFALAKKSTGNLEYHDAEPGYLYLKVQPGKEDVCRKEWADFKALAGKKEIIAFGARHTLPHPVVRKADAKPENPDLHPLGIGVTRVHPDLANRPQIRQLQKLMSNGAKTSSANK